MSKYASLFPPKCTNPKWLRKNPCGSYNRDVQPQGHSCSLFPPNPNIYSISYRLREVLATSWPVGSGDGWGQGHGSPPSPAFQRAEARAAKARTVPAVSTQEHLSSFLVLLTPPVPSQWGPVCDGNGGWGTTSFFPGTRVCTCEGILYMNLQRCYNM